MRRLANRREPGFALLEGPRVVAEAAAAGVRIEVLAVREGDAFEAIESDRRITLAPAVFRAVSQVVTPQGVVAIAKVEEATPSVAIAAARSGRWPLVVLDRVQDPANVGAICRTAAAAGAPALVVLQGTADPFGAKSVRSSAGNVFRLVVARGAWDDLAALDGYGAAAAGGTPLDATPIENAGMIVLGSEAHGLSRADLKTVTIPLHDGVESLNVAAAAAVLLFEVKRRKAA
jgi:TrmH family RNA methyltransferase